MEINGKDWSSVKFDNMPDNLEIKNYFEEYKSLFGHEISPINLGVYKDINYTTEDEFRSTKYIGVMPMVDLDTLKPYNKDKDLCVLKIDSRFHISPSEMLKYVLDGDDYYENPKMLQCKAYSISEVKKLFEKGQKNKVLCGIIKDIGKVSLKNTAYNGVENVPNLNPLLSSVYPIFEIIRFVNFTKDLCKKTLKHQSAPKEENLVGKVKGRILINKQVKHNISRGQYHKVFCSYNTLSENIKENIILKYTLHLCSKFSLADSLNEDIIFCNRALAGVPLKKCTPSDFIGLKNNGAFRHYKQALDSAKVIVNRYYISYDNSSDEEGKNEYIQIADYSIDPYFIDMNLLFEYYCRALFRKAVNEFNVENKDDKPPLCNEYSLSLDPATRGNISIFDSENSIKEFYMKTYIPDIVVRYKKKGENSKGEILTVIDAKYSDVKSSYDKRGRTHQIFFYMNVLNSMYGGLISPLSEENGEKNFFPKNIYMTVILNPNPIRSYAIYLYINLTIKAAA